MSASSQESQVSLIELSKQLPFDIDNKIKEELCFGETLIVSCGHYDGDIGDDDSESEWSCHETIETETSDDKEDDMKSEMKLPPEIDLSNDKLEEEENDFHFYFFPDCEKPQPPQDSRVSLTVVNGMPKLNTQKKDRITCTCKVDKSGNCDCYIKLPCKCGAKTKAECSCATLKEICICHEGKPQQICRCKGSDVCVCSPDGKVMPVCTCHNVDKPCVCYAEKFPSPNCTCKHKPKIVQAQDVQSQVGGEGEVFGEDYVSVGKSINEQEPCECQKRDPKLLCYCLKGKKCICKEIACICGVQKACVCEPTDSKEIICIKEDSKSICSCQITKECTCDAQSPSDCTYHVPVKVCMCGDPENCRCSKICDCTDPCICDTAPMKLDECTCLGEKVAPCDVCICPLQTDDTRKLKKVRAGKHGYRWCHEVDPQHTYFDYAYGRHDKISYEVPDIERVKILGLNDEKSEDEVCPVHSVKAPQYEKKVRKPSIDCCSSVGGISICVESLGEDKDRFLVQVVSHSSKEGAKTGSKLISILDCNLHTMEENRIEHITKGTVTKERRSYMAICESGYYNKVTRICGDKDVVKRFYHSFDQAHNFLLEGANIVLMRYISLRRYRGNLRTETVLMDGTICASIYVCQGVSQAIVNGKPMFVVKIERHIIEPTGYIRQTLTVLTLRGHIVTHEWADNCYILHINPLLKVVPEKDEIEPHAPLREKWREDLQLHSDYLDFKSTRLSEGARYVMESGALTGVVRDYLQAILLLRPQDTLHFTRHYFGSVLSALDLPHDEYFDPSTKHVRYYFFED